jgi:hypothetical protein
MSARRVLRPAPRRGVCRYCRCTDTNACVITIRAHTKPPCTKSITCSWINKQQTVCSAPSCLRKHRAHERAKKMRQRIRIRHGRQLFYPEAKRGNPTGFGKAGAA